VCDKGDKIVDYNSLENDIIQGQCKYEDKGLTPPKPTPNKEISKPSLNKEISKPTPEKNPLFPSSSMPPSNDDNNFEKYISKFIDIHIPKIFK
jgi:hypothetical protein